MNNYNRTAQDKLNHILELITGFRLCDRNIIYSINLLTSIGIVLSKLNFVSAIDKGKYLQEHLRNFSDSNSFSRQLTVLVVDCIQEATPAELDNRLLFSVKYITKSEKILLLSYANIIAEKSNDRVIQNIAKLLEIDDTYLRVINSENRNSKVIEEIKKLLDPANFKHLDLAVSKVAQDAIAILAKPSEKQKEIKNLDTAKTSYEHLQQYQRSCQQLDKYCYELHQVMDECHQDDLIPDTFITEISNISRQLQSRSFRIAVVGEFSQGKSTLLNALLKEEIQPVRAIPCSGTVTVLKYGAQKKVICRYKDGKEEEIPLEQYHQKAAISEAAALDGVSDELATSEIKEIVFEHPDLELCRHGVEIVDSPGLNEHPQRSAITEQLIKDTDAVIFLANASRLLTQGERELIEEIKTKLNAGDKNKAAKNLFIVVNFMDLLRRQTDRASVKQRIERFAYNDNPIIEGDNRIHFISAQAALDAIQEGYEDEYLNSFNNLTKSIETFLTNDIGSIKLNHNANKVKSLIQSFKTQQIEDKQEILEEIGVISSWDVELYQLAVILEEEAINEAVDSWNKWADKIEEIIDEDSEEWSSTQEDEARILTFFSKKFNSVLTNELNKWLQHKVQNNILKSKFKIIDSEIESIVEALQDLFEGVDNKLGSNIKAKIESSISKQQVNLNLNIGNIEEQEGDGVGFSLGLGSAGLIGAGLLAFTGIGLVPIALAAIGGGMGLGSFFGESKQDKIKRIVLDRGLEQFYESQQETFDKISEQISLVFENRVKANSELIKEAILILESLIEMQEELEEKNNKINKIDSNIDILVSQVTK